MTEAFAVRTIAQYERERASKVLHTVSEDNTHGALTCTCITDNRASRAPDWCEHIENVIMDQLDARPMGANPTIAFRELPDSLVIPMVPSERFWVQVVLGTEPDFKSVYLDSGLKAGLAKPGEDPWVPLRIKTTPDKESFLGYIGPGEGRRVIRTMVFEWLRPQRKRVFCKSKLHKTQRWSKSDPHTSPLAPADWAALWSLVAQGACKDCLTFQMDFSQDAPQLSIFHVPGSDIAINMDALMAKKVNEFMNKYRPAVTRGEVRYRYRYPI